MEAGLLPFGAYVTDFCLPILLSSPYAKSVYIEKSWHS